MQLDGEIHRIGVGIFTHHDGNLYQSNVNVLTHLDGKVQEDSASVVGPAVETVGGQAEVGVGQEVPELVVVESPVVHVADAEVTLCVFAPALVRVGGEARDERV